MNQNSLYFAPVLLLGICFALTGCRAPATTSPLANTTAKPTAKSATVSTKPSADKSKIPSDKRPTTNAAKPMKGAPKAGGKVAFAPQDPAKATAAVPKPSLQNFPKDAPIYQSATLVGVGKSDKGVVAGLETKDAPQKVMSFYQKQLPAQGWKVKSATTTEQGGVLEAAKNKRRCFVNIGFNSKTKTTTFSVTVVQN